MTNRAWNMLREQFKPDSKGRFKTIDAMSIAKQLAEENEKLQADVKLLSDLLKKYTRTNYRNK